MAETLVQKQAPDFSGPAVVDGNFVELKLSDYKEKGKWVVLFFYPLDFTFVCPTEITAFSDAVAEFKALNAEVVACSVDSKYSHLAWTQKPRNDGGLGKIEFPLLSDITKKVAADYGVLTSGGIALRGLFLINPKGTVVYSVVHDLNVGRSVDEVLRVLAAFQQADKTGEVCPANWKPGSKTMKANPKDSKVYFASVAK